MGDLMSPEDREAVYREFAGLPPTPNGKPPSDEELIRLIAAERRRREARRVVDEEEAPKLPPLRFWGGSEFLRATLEPAPMVVDLFARSGHNVVVSAQYKAGKSTLMVNLLRALVEGRPFLGSFEVPAARRVAYLNLEVGEADMQDWLRALGIHPDAWERFVVGNLRGRVPRINIAPARAEFVSRLRDAGSQDVILDCVRPMAAACGMDENSNGDMGRFTGWWDEIKHEAGLSTLWLVHHTGRAPQEAGAERARGATVLDDWPDMRVMLVKDDEAPGKPRFVRTEGRVEGLDETQLHYDCQTHILSVNGKGIDRRTSRRLVIMGKVREVVESQPGIGVRDLRSELPFKAVDSDSAIREAIGRGEIHFHDGPNRSKVHYPGERRKRLDGGCDCGWKESTR